MISPGNDAEPRPRPCRIGVVGAGGMGADHVRAAAGAGAFVIAAVCDIDPAAARAVAEPAGASTHTDHREMFDSAGLDAVVVAAPHGLHAPIVDDAARAGLHVLVEKPMATTVADCTRMMSACAAAGTVLAVAHIVHFLPAACAARRIVRSGEYGRLLLVSHQRSARYEPGSRPSWFFDPRLAGGGIVLNVGTHGLDRIQWFADSPIRRVTATVRGRPGLEVETDALAHLELADGVAANLTLTSRGAPYFDETEVVLERATLRLSATEGLILFRDGRCTMLRAADPADVPAALRAQLDGFVAAAQKRDEDPYVSGDYGRSVVAAALAMYASAERGERVELAADGTLR